MCLIVFAWQIVPGMPLFAAANRDEFYDRPTSPASWWSDYPQVYAGRDLRGQGTWMGVTRDGRFAAITNIRAPLEQRSDAPSRGVLVSNYLTGTLTPEAYIEEIASKAHIFNSFNLLIGDPNHLIWFSNAKQADERNGKPLVPGIYGISNGVLDTPWPKLVRTKAQFASLLFQGAPEEAYFEMLSDTTRASDCRLPCTGLTLEREKALSAVCIDLPDYGTRSSTLVQLFPDNRAVLREQWIK